MAKYWASKQRDCGLRIVKTETGKSSWAIASKKDWSWNHLISQKMLEYKENGVLSDINRKWTNSACTAVGSSESALESFAVEYFGGLIIILIGFIVFSFLLLLVEYAWNRYRRRITDPVKNSIKIWAEGREERKTSVQVISCKRRSGFETS